MPRLNGGGGGGCPVLVFGIRKALLTEDVPDGELTQLVEEFKAGRKSKWKTNGPILTRYFDPALLRKTPISEEDE
jgi:hypothetical protein